MRAGGSLTGALPAALLATSLALCAFGCSSPIITFRAGQDGDKNTTGKSETADARKAAADRTPDEPAATGSIRRTPATFGADLGEEDWRRAHAALGVALDPQGNGRPVRWDNPETGLRGSVNPTGLPYVVDVEICRDFLATVVIPGADDRSRFLRGTGCKPTGGEWALKRVRNLTGASPKTSAGAPHKAVRL